ncbi:hypothetical protein BS78_05G067900 [Paspalum vaginatum]|nr:hypothetical protein BS78_05G067900 [Paspalum vaginatum]
MATHAAPRRFRASPSSLVKLCKTMSQAQHERIDNEEFGGLLNIACKRVPVEFASWLMVDCYDAETRELVLQGRGRIPVNAEAVHNVLGLHRGGDPVIYEFDLDALNFIHDAYQLQNGEAPRIKTILKLIQDKEEADDEFFRSWLMIAVSTFCAHQSVCQSASDVTQQ